jgi:hypothetical protein
VTDHEQPIGGGRQPPEIEIDITTAHPARVHNFLAGGDANFAVDREAVEKAVDMAPDEMEVARRAVQAMAGFQARVVRHLVVDVGVTQFLKLGAAVPAGEDVHEVAQAAAPGTRVVYTGDDPTVLAHAHGLRQARPEGITAYVHGTLLDIDPIIAQASATLDLDRPVAVLSPANMAFVAEEDDPYGIVARILAALVPGSYLALAHSSPDVGSERMRAAAERFARLLGDPYVVRTRDQIARFFAGLDLVDPGLVPIEQWRPAPGEELDPTRRPVPLYGALARKPAPDTEADS